jgi:hypothetical protein
VSFFGGGPFVELFYLDGGIFLEDETSFSPFFLLKRFCANHFCTFYSWADRYEISLSFCGPLETSFSSTLSPTSPRSFFNFNYTAPAQTLYCFAASFLLLHT